MKESRAYEIVQHQRLRISMQMDIFCAIKRAAPGL